MIKDPMAENIQKIYRNQHTPSDRLPPSQQCEVAKDQYVEVMDTGGQNPPIVFAHPHTGSAESFAFQLQAFADLGYRAIAYSRQGHGASKPVQAEGDAVTLGAVLGALKITQPVHLVGVAAGGMECAAFAINSPKSVASLTFACSLITPEDDAWSALFKSAHGPWLKELPPEIRELSGGFRAAYPKETVAWRKLAAASETIAPKRIAPGVTLEGLKKLEAPKLIIAGAADLYLAPALAAEAAKQISADFAVIDHIAHAPHFEMPHHFNALVSAFIAKISHK